MDQTPVKPGTLRIDFNGKSYSCKTIVKNGMVLYQINFNTSYLYLTMARDSRGYPFWTSIPEDSKLKHVVQVLGEQIENQLK